jgi:hypothetical protein
MLLRLRRCRLLALQRQCAVQDDPQRQRPSLLDCEREPWIPTRAGSSASRSARWELMTIKCPAGPASLLETNTIGLQHILLQYIDVVTKETQDWFKGHARICVVSITNHHKKQ